MCCVPFSEFNEKSLKQGNVNFYREIHVFIIAVSFTNVLIFQPHYYVFSYVLECDVIII